MTLEALQRRIEALAKEAEPDRDAALAPLTELLDALESGRVRAAEPEGDGWSTRTWVKQGILLAFRIGRDREDEVGAVFRFRDRDILPVRGLPDPDPAGVRIVPGGTTVRRGAFLGDGVVIMPPSYVNIGAWIGPGTMVDSHALVGSCAQIGRGVHLSAAAQIGGVLEPVGALPVIVEDDAFVGGGAGVYEGTRIGAGAVLAPGVVLTRAVAIHDLVHQTVHRAKGSEPLEVPPGAVIVPGSRPARGEWAAGAGLQLQCPVIVKYRDAGTSAAVSLETALR